MKRLAKGGQISKQYSDFNAWVFDYYHGKNPKGEQGCLAIDESDYGESGFKGVFFREISDGNWNELFQIDFHYREIPLFFGLIGLQCLAATAVKNNQIREEFRAISGIESLQKVDRYFREPFGSHTIQDELWIRVQNYLNDYRKINIEIPKPKTRKDRYIQYPKSQVVLNRQDLIEYKSFCEDLYNKMGNEAISFSDFKKELQLRRLNQTFSRKNNKNQERTDTEEKIRLGQVFNYYNSDSWQYDEENKKIYNRHRLDNENYSLRYDADNNFIIYKDIDNECAPSDVLKNNKFCFFRKHERYGYEFEHVDFLEYNVGFIILYKKDNDTFSDNSFGEEIPYENILYGFRYVFYVESEKVEPNFFIDYFITEKKAIRFAGLRIGRKDTYFKDLGPEMIHEEGVEFDIYLNGQKLSYNPYNCIPGIYRVKRVGYSDIKFQIIDYQPCQLILDQNENGIGWRLDSLRLSDTGNRLIGAKFINDNSSMTNILTLNKWISANREPDSKEDRNRFLNLIKRYHHGN